MKWALALLLVVFIQAQAVGGFSPAVDYIWLGARWVQLPKFPGDVGVVSVSFYFSQQQIDVAIALTSTCVYITPLESVQLPSAGPGVVTVSIKVAVRELDRVCPMTVIFKSRHQVSGASLSTGLEKVEYVELYIPPYPTAEVKTVGTVYLNTPSTIELIISSPHRLVGIATIQGIGARVLEPAGYVVVNNTLSTIRVVVVADSPNAALRVDIQTRDWLGTPVVLTYTVPMSVTPPPTSLVEITPTVLYSNRYNEVNITVLLPFEVDGNAVVTISGGAAPLSSFTIPISKGRGSSIINVYPIATAVTFTTQINYLIGGVSKTEVVTATAAVQPAVGGVARVEVKPTRLLAGLANNMSIVVKALGYFNVSLTVTNAAVDKAMPFYFGGSGEAAANLVVTPLSTLPVSINVNVYTAHGVEQYTVQIPVVSSSIFTVVPRPSLVKSGGNRSIVLNIVNSGDIAVERAVVTISPGTSAIIASTYTYQVGSLRPLDSVELPISFIAPVTLSGAVPFVYTIVYTTELGTVGSVQGTFYIQAVQVPMVNITSAVVVPATPEPKRTFYISLSVVNRGFSQISNLQVEAAVPRGVAPVTSPIYFAGALDPQQTASIPMSFNASSPGIYEIKFTLSYTDVYGNIYTIPYTVTVTVVNSTPPAPTPTASPTGGGHGVVLAIVAAAVVVAVALSIFRKQMKRPTSTETR